MSPDQILRHLLGLTLGPWLRLWQRASRRGKRALTLLGLTAATLLAGAGAAYADGSDAPAALSWINVKDSHGISIWQYEMSLEGGGLTDPVKGFTSFLVDISWQAYRAFIAIACWLVDMALSFEWLSWIAAPAIAIGDSVQAMVNRFGATETFLTIATVFAVIWMMKGRWALGFFELFTSMIIASVATGALASPVRLVAGPDGLLMGSRDAGLELAVGLSHDGDTTGSPDELRKQTTGTLVETFLRTPLQIVNFGQVIDGTKCGKSYQEALKDGPYGDGDELRDSVGDCDAASEAAQNPNSNMLMSMWALVPAGLFMALLAFVLGLAVMAAAANAVYQAIKLIVALVTGLLPGTARGSLWMTLSEVIVSQVIIVCSVVFLTGYLLFLQSIFIITANPMKVFFIVDLMMLIGIYLFWKYRTQLKKSAASLARLMSNRPGLGPVNTPSKLPFNPVNTYYKGKMAASVASTVGGGVGAGALAAGKSYKSLTGKSVNAVGDAADRTGARIRLAASLVDTHAPTGNASAPPADRLKGRLQPAARSGGAFARVAVPLALAAATGGSSAVMQQAALQGARRAALQTRLHPRALPAGPSSSNPSPGRPGAPQTPSSPSPRSRIQPGPSSPPQIPARATPAAITGPAHAPRAQQHAGNDADRLRARLAAARAIPMPPSRAIPMPAPTRAIPLPPKQPPGKK